METKRYQNRMGNEAIILSRYTEMAGKKASKAVKCRIIKGVTFEAGLEFSSSEEQYNKDWRAI